MENELPIDFQNIDVETLLQSAGPSLAIGAVLYIYFGICFTVIANKTQTRHSWMAWIPFLNVVLMCQIGRVSLAWLLAFFIPCLNFIAVIVLFSAIAAARGKSPIAGLLILIPGINLFVPLWLAMGPSTAAPGAAAVAATGPRRCAKCGTIATAVDAFCGECGSPLPAAAPAAPQAAANQGGGNSGCGVFACGVAGVMFLGLIVACGGGGYFLLQETAYEQPTREIPEMPQRMAGTLREFPIDDDPTNPSIPTAIVSQDFSQGDRSVKPQTPAEWLPPGVKPRTLADNASAVTSAVYRATPESPPVNIHVVEPSRGARSAEALARRVFDASSGRRKRAEVTTSRGDVYEGYSLESDAGLTFVLISPRISICIIVYAPDPAAAPVARRLVQNVGNGNGLLEPVFQPLICVLPARPPRGFILRQIRVVSSGEILMVKQELNRWADESDDAGVQDLAAKISFLLPKRITSAEYESSNRSQWGVAAFDYGRPRVARWIWTILNWAATANGATTAQVNGQSAFHFDTGEQRILFYRKGPFVMFVGGPNSEPLEMLLDLAEQTQL